MNCFPFMAISEHLHTCLVWTYVFFSDSPNLSSGVVCNFIFMFLRNCQTIFQNSCNLILFSTSNVWGCLFFCILPTFDIFYFFDRAATIAVLLWFSRISFTRFLLSSSLTNRYGFPRVMLLWNSLNFIYFYFILFGDDELLFWITKIFFVPEKESLCCLYTHIWLKMLDILFFVSSDFKTWVY